MRSVERPTAWGSHMRRTQGISRRNLLRHSAAMTALFAAWRVSPALDADQSGLAPALIYNAGFDPLTTQGAEYAARLKAAGVPVVYRCYDSLSHSFTAMSGVVPAARKALAEMAADVKQAFGRGA